MPFVDAHSWRQVTNADVARLWTEGPIDFFYPAVSWGGPDGRVGLEFPLLHLLMALAWRPPASAMSAAARARPFLSGHGLATYRLGTRLFDRAAGRAAAFLMAVSPSLVYFGRTPLSDTPMLTFSVGAVLGYVGYAQTGSRVLAMAGAVSLALAGLVKIPAILVLGPIGIVGIPRRRPSRMARPLVHRGTARGHRRHRALVPARRPGLPGNGADPGDLPPVGHLCPRHRPMGRRVHHRVPLDAGPAAHLRHAPRARDGLLAAAPHADLRRGRAHRPAAVALATRPAGPSSTSGRWRRQPVAVSLQGQIAHEFHQLPALPPLALYFGMGAAPLFDRRTYDRFAGPWRMAAIGATAARLAWVAVRGFVDSGVIRRLYRPDAMNTGVVAAGRAIDRPHRARRAHRHRRIRALRQQLADAALLRPSQGLELR